MPREPEHIEELWTPNYNRSGLFRWNRLSPGWWRCSNDGGAGERSWGELLYFHSPVCEDPDDVPLRTASR